MTKEINSDQVNQAAHEYLVEVSNIHMNPVTATYINRAFVAGSDWQLAKSSATIRHWREQVGKLQAEIAGLKDLRASLPDGAGGIRAEPLKEGGYVFHAFGDHDALEAIRKSYHEGVRDMASQSVPLTEILAAIMGAKDQLQDAQFELRHMIVDVGQKVEAVLDQVMPKDVSDPAAYDREECLLKHDHETIVMLDERINRIEAEREEWKAQALDWHGAYDKLVSDIVHGRKPDVDPSGCRALPDAASYEEACRAAVASEPVTDESGISVGAGSFSTSAVIGVDLAAPGTDKTVITLRAADGVPHNVTPPVWAGPIVEVVTFGGRLLVCCQNGVFSLDGPYLRPLKFV